MLNINDSAFIHSYMHTYIYMYIYIIRGSPRGAIYIYIYTGEVDDLGVYDRVMIFGPLFIAYSSWHLVLQLWNFNLRCVTGLFWQLVTPQFWLRICTPFKTLTIMFWHVLKNTYIHTIVRNKVLSRWVNVCSYVSRFIQNLYSSYSYFMYEGKFKVSYASPRK